MAAGSEMGVIAEMTPRCETVENPRAPPMGKPLELQRRQIMRTVQRGHAGKPHRPLARGAAHLNAHALLGFDDFGRRQHMGVGDDQRAVGHRKTRTPESETRAVGRRIGAHQHDGRLRLFDQPGQVGGNDGGRHTGQREEERQGAT